MKAAPPPLKEALSCVLDDMQQVVDQLLGVLEAERSALANSSPEALDHAGTRKQALMLQLEQLDGERLLLCRQHPAVPAAAGAAWARVLQSLAHCHKLNQRNGSAVNQRLAQVRHALAILTGHPGESELYGRSGELHASLRSQVLAAA